MKKIINIKLEPQTKFFLQEKFAFGRFIRTEFVVV